MIKKKIFIMVKILLIISMINCFMVPVAQCADSENVDLISKIAGGLPQDVFVQGNYAYVVAGGIFQ